MAHIHSKIFLLICLTVLFEMFLWLIDVSVSAINVNCFLTGSPNGIPTARMVLQSLVFDNIEPRVSYHFALVGLIALWLFLVSLLLWGWLNDYSKLDKEKIRKNRV